LEIEFDDEPAYIFDGDDDEPVITATNRLPRIDMGID
jgi:hypothetical protein